MSSAAADKTPALQILGGGPAGLAAAFYAHRKSMSFSLFEGSPVVGGNARTMQLGNCLFDSGAHRLHDKNARVTADIRSLLGTDLLSVTAPSQIYTDGRYLRFPLQPDDLLRKLSWSTLARMAMERIRGPRNAPATDFRAWAVGKYGQTLAELLLLNYSEKLWGEKAENLSTAIAGGRLRNLDLRAFLLSAVGAVEDQGHLDGTFLYPKFGFGSIFERLANVVGRIHIHCNSRITAIYHNQERIQRLEINGTTILEPQTILSSLPINRFIHLLRPQPPEAIRQAAAKLRFRHLILCVYTLRRDRFTDNASIYFPEPDFPFTRLYECKNRSPFTAPRGETAIVLEWPCHPDDAIWQTNDDTLLSQAMGALSRVEPLTADDISGRQVHRMSFAYPLLTTLQEKTMQVLEHYVSRFHNLHPIGRSATFTYLHTHDLFEAAHQTMEQLESAVAL